MNKLTKGEAVSWIISELERERDEHKTAAENANIQKVREFNQTWVEAYKIVLDKFYQDERPAPGFPPEGCGEWYEFDQQGIAVPKNQGE